MKIEKNVPMPPHGNHLQKYPWPEMSVGDSVFFSREEEAKPRSIVRAAHGWGGRNNAKFASRSVDGGFRIWRTE